MLVFADKVGLPFLYFVFFKSFTEFRAQDGNGEGDNLASVLIPFSKIESHSTNIPAMNVSPATALPTGVTGKVSPYPTVVIVTRDVSHHELRTRKPIDHHSVWGML